MTCLHVCWLCVIFFVGTLSVSAQTSFWQPTGGPGGGSIHALVAAPDGKLFAVVGKTDHAILYHSIDGGTTWSVLLGHEDGIRTVVVSPEGAVFVVSWRGAMLRSEDDGQTWQSLNNPGEQMHALAFDPQGRLLIGGDAVYRSDDNGQTWESLNLEVVRVNDFAFTDTGDIVVATSESLYRSDDDGTSWVEISSPSQPKALVVHPNGNLYLGVAGVAVPGKPLGLFRLEEEGQVVLVGLEGRSILSLAVDAEGQLFAGTAGTCTGEVCFPPAGVYRSTDGGETWMSAGLISTPVSVLVVDEQGRLFAGTQGLATDTGDLLSRGILRSADYGTTWTQASEGIPHAQTYGLYPGPEGVLYAAADHSVYRSADHGAHWVPIYTHEPTVELPDPPYYTLGVHPEGDLFLLAGHPSRLDGGIHAVLYMQAQLLHSPDQGRTWTTVKPDLGVVGSLAVTARGTLLVATPEGILHSIDQGETWTSLATGLPDKPVLTIAAVDTGPVFAATYDPQSWEVDLFYSTDDGVSWTTVGNVESVLIPERFSLSARDAETLYAGSQVFKMNQPGSPWVSSALGLPVRDLTFDAEGKLYATANTGSDEVFRSLDDGVTWEPLNDGLPAQLRVMPLAVDAGGYLYAGSEQGVFRSVAPVATSVAPERDIPEVFELESSFPNPFRQTTHIPFTLARPSHVTLKVYDLLGREQATLLEETFLQAGEYEVVWTAADGLPSGTYLYNLIAEHRVRTGSLILLR